MRFREAEEEEVNHRLHRFHRLWLAFGRVTIWPGKTHFPDTESIKTKPIRRSQSVTRPSASPNPNLGNQCNLWLTSSSL
ncbi:MAG: hypothetical protein QOI53_2387 [Verrucomicrobiota bacterium]|nr:hypothetical protein [Verrucomicrobiota bacterium]